MTLLYYHSDFLSHDTGQHPECGERLRRVVSHLKQNDLWDRCTPRDVPSASAATIQLVHDSEYIRRIDAAAQTGGGRVESDTVVSRDSYVAACRAVGAGCDAVSQVAQGVEQNALCLVRPPGHHAVRANPMGFCLFNNVAVAAQFALQQLDMDRVVIVDWDVHHGNGTQDAFWESEQVGFFSAHRFPFYPGSGEASETGRGAGLGATRNLPIKFGIDRADYLQRVSRELTEFVDRMKPDLILLSAGFDSHRLDPIGSLGLESEDFAVLTDLATELARSHCGGRLVSMLEGGYNVDVLPQCVDVHLSRLLAAH